jgi:hypothetical protein
MGGKSDLYTRMDRPSSGGADKNDVVEKSNLQELDKEAYAKEMAQQRGAASGQADGTVPFSTDNEPNNVKRSQG